MKNHVQKLYAKMTVQGKERGTNTESMRTIKVQYNSM